MAGSTTGAGLCAPFLGVEFYRQCAPGRSRALRARDKWPPETTGATSMRPFCFANRFAGLRPHRGLSCFSDPGPRLCPAPTALHSRPLRKETSAGSSAPCGHRFASQLYLPACGRLCAPFGVRRFSGVTAPGRYRALRARDKWPSATPGPAGAPAHLRCPSAR